MNFKKLSIHNIASIEDAVIDFTSEPLASEPLFLICGDTGAGKSVILDAICLALYRETPRIKGSNDSDYIDELFAKKDRDGKVTANVVRFKDVRQLMRRGAKEAFAELEFVGNDGKNYCARWSVRFNRNGNIDAEKQELNSLDDGRVFSKVAEVKAVIATCVGLEYEQFCRTSLLAQGEFTKFLSSDDNSKSDILQKLTGTDIYERIGAEIAQKRSELHQEIIAKKAAVEAHSLMSDEEVALVRSEIEELQKKEREHSELCAQLETKRAWLAEFEKCGKRIEAAEAKLSEVDAVMNGEAFAADVALLEEWDLTCDVRDVLKELDLQENELKNLQRQEYELKDDFAKFNGGVRSLESRLAEIQKEASELNRLIETEKANAQMYADAQSILAKLDNCIEERSRAEKNAELAERSRRERLPEINLSLNKVSDELKRCEAALKDKSDKLEAIAKKLEQMRLDELNCEKNRLNSSLDLLKDAKLALEKYNGLILNIDKVENDKREAEEFLTDGAAREAELKSALQSLEADVTLKKDVLEKVRLCAEDLVVSLRSQLGVGDDCPVCGQKIISLKTDKAFAESVEPYREELNVAEKRLRDAGGDLNTLNAALHLKRDVLKKLQQNCEAFKADAASAKSALRELCQRLNLKADDADLESLLEREADSVAERLKAADLQLAEISSLQNELAKLQKEKDSQAAERNKLLEEKALAERRLVVCESEIKSFTSLSEQSKCNAENAMAEIAPKIVYADWAGDLNATAKKLKSDAANYEQNVKLMETLTKDCELKTAVLQNAKAANLKILEDFPDWNICCADGADIEDVNRYSAQIIADVFTLKSKLTDNAKRRQKAASDIDLFLKSNAGWSAEKLSGIASKSTDFIESVRCKVSELRNSKSLLIGEANSGRAAFEELCKTRPEDLTDDLSAESLAAMIAAESEELKACSQLIGGKKNQLDTEERNRALLAEKRTELQSRTILFEKWERLNKMFGANKGKAFNKIAQSYVLQELLSCANGYLKRLNMRYELSCQSGSLGILVRDMYLGGVQRPGNTLSGGESFIVSLSLALGLSSLGGSRLTTDIIFIDEGFGTLSTEYLNSVLELLERLHGIGGKKVGLISHVEVLRERIPVQIRVNKRGTSGASEIITGNFCNIN